MLQQSHFLARQLKPFSVKLKNGKMPGTEDWNWEVLAGIFVNGRKILPQVHHSGITLDQ